MYLKNRDKEIIKFIEEYGSITINQCSNIFYNHCSQKYDLSRKRLKLISENGYIKRNRKSMIDETVYYMKRKLTDHKLKVIDVYSRLFSKGIKVREFKMEYVVNIGKVVSGKEKSYRLDGFLEFEYKGYFYSFIIEVDKTHQTSKRKLVDIYESGYFQNKYKENGMGDNIYPDVLIVKSNSMMMNYLGYMDEEFNIDFIDWELNGIERVLE